MSTPTSSRRLWRWRSPKTVPTALKGIPGSPVAFALFAVALIAGLANYVFAERSRTEATRQHDIITLNERLLSTMKDLETGMRGYTLTGLPNYLTPYKRALDTLDGQIGELDRLESESADPGTARRQELRTLITGERDFARRVVEARDASGFEAAVTLVRTGEGKRMMDRHPRSHPGRPGPCPRQPRPLREDGILARADPVPRLRGLGPGCDGAPRPHRPAAPP